MTVREEVSEGLSRLYRLLASSTGQDCRSDAAQLAIGLACKALNPQFIITQHEIQALGYMAARIVITDAKDKL